MSRYPAYTTYPEADTSSDPLPEYMLVDRVAKPCKRHEPLALLHRPGADDSIALRLRFGMTNKVLVCRFCGATAVHGLSQLRWGDWFNTRTKAGAIEFNRQLAQERAARTAVTGQEGKRHA